MSGKEMMNGQGMSFDGFLLAMKERQENVTGGLVAALKQMKKTIEAQKVEIEELKKPKE